jgi:hypothetical protein
MGPAKQAAYHLNRPCSSVGGLTAFPKRTCSSYRMVPEGGDEAVLVPRPVRPTPSTRFVGAWPPLWERSIEDGSPSLKGIDGLNGYSSAILGHIHPPSFPIGLHSEP